MREFTFEDGFALSEIIDKMQLTLDINALGDAMKKGNTEAQAYFGGQLMLQFAKKLHLAKDEVISFVAKMTGDSKDEVKKYPIQKIKAVFTELFKSEGLADFFN